jgi:hypothetical protein
MMENIGAVRNGTFRTIPKRLNRISFVTRLDHLNPVDPKNKAAASSSAFRHSFVTALRDTPVHQQRSQRRRETNQRNPSSTGSILQRRKFMPLHSPPATVPSTHDRQPIKYKSFRIAPAELEAMLLSHPAVADVAVVAAPDRDVGELPKALVVLRSEISGD